MSLRTTAATRFDSFNLYRTSYKKIGDHEIEVNVLVPKGTKPGKHPVLVKWHGGGLSTGTAAYPNWFGGFFVPFLHRNSAIAILPNYRLTPEHTGKEILEDITDFWAWFKTSLPAYVDSKERGFGLDFTKVLVSGDSAGGWCALQSVLSLPEGSFKASLIQYPLVNSFPVSPTDTPMGLSIGSKEELDEILAAIKPGTVVSGATPPARGFLTTMMQAHGRWDEYFGTGKELMPDTRVEDAKFLAPTYIIHPEDDSVVPVKWTHAFVEKAKKALPDAKIKLVSPPGEHGFDIDMYEEDQPWLKELLKEVEGDWLA
ncbi:Alpha/Beta hydrolase protein [Lophiotrema nucula]|uniref:Alpha/Beta hydrolase protein n=1 Tax=Lophiotrema nucula TaxID=690887 RepID=A0A6A5YQB4_9PLEO|nr:Alpha/Beta hydrolase protein [Lophiotrema nucula]